MNLAQSVVVMAVHISYVLSTTVEWQIIESINSYRNALLILDPYPALQLANDVRITDRALLKIFKETCNKYEELISEQIPKRLFPKYKLGKNTLSSLPNNVLEYFSLKASDGISASTLLAKASQDQRFSVRMALYQWNHLIEALYKCSEEIRLCIRDIPETKKQAGVMKDRLHAAQVILMYLFKISFADERDAVVLYHFLEFLRHFICVQWKEVHTREHLEQAKDIWRTFVIQPKRDQKESIFEEVDKIAAVEMNWPTNYLKNAVRIKKMSSNAMALGLKAIGDEVGRGGYLELLLKQIPTEFYPGILHLMQRGRIRNEPPITLLHAVLCLFRICSNESSKGNIILSELVKEFLLEYLKSEVDYRETFIQNITIFSEGVLYGRPPVPLKKLCLPHELLAFYDEGNLTNCNYVYLGCLSVEGLRLRFVNDPEAAALYSFLSSKALYFWRKFRMHSAYLTDSYIEQQRFLLQGLTSVQVAKRRIEYILLHMKDIFTLHPHLSWKRITSVLYLLEYVRIVGYLQSPPDEAFMFFVEKAASLLLQKTGSMLIEWKDLRIQILCEPLVDFYLISGKTDSIVYKAKAKNHGERLSHAEVHVVPFEPDITREEDLEGGGKIIIFRKEEKLILNLIIHIPKSINTPEIDLRRLFHPLYASPGKVINLDDFCDYICRNIHPTNEVK